MAGKRINDPSLPRATQIKDDDVFYLIQDGQDFAITGEVLRATLAVLTNPMTAKGDLIAGGVDGVPARFAIGATGKFLSVDVDGNLSWVDRPGSSSGTGLINPMTAQNDLIVGGTDGEAIRLEAGAAGQYLTIDGGVLVWKDLPAHEGELSNPMTEIADLIVGGAAGAPTRLEKGNDGDTLKMVGGVIQWVTVGSARAVVRSVTQAGGTSDGTLNITKLDDGKYLRIQTHFVGADVWNFDLTVQSQANTEWLADAEVTIEQAGDSIITIVGAPGVTINKMVSFSNRTRGKYAVITLKRVDQNVWTLFGQLETP